MTELQTRTKYTYDAENRILTYSNTAGATASYTYDAFGRRTEKNTGSGVLNECNSSGPVYYLYDLNGEAEVYTTNGVNQCKDEYFVGARHLAHLSAQVYYDHTDWLGTVRASLYSGSTSVNIACTSLPFGEDLNCTPDIYASPLHFTGKERDAESGLDNFGARYYSSSMGRFMIPDWSTVPEPIFYADLDNPQTINLYSYVHNNPLSQRDATGHYHCDPDTVTWSGSGVTVTAGACHIDWYDSAFVAGVFGHHGVPQAISKTLELSEEAQAFLRLRFVTGRLAGQHFYDAAHRAYNRAIQRLVARYMLTRAAAGREGELAVEEAKEIAGKVLDSKDPEVADFLDNLPKTSSGESGREALERVVEGDVSQIPDAAEVLGEAAAEAAAEEGVVPPL